jgi:hypothetical protein
MARQKKEENKDNEINTTSPTIKKQEEVKKVEKVKTTNEPKYPAKKLADEIGIHRFDFDTISKLKNIKYDDLITKSELVELYNKILRR